jgi:AraC family transcriptional regulator
MTSIESPSITDLLLAWQSSGSAADMQRLVDVARPLIEKQASTILRRFGVRSPAAVDDVVSLVLDHVRRLHPTDDSTSPVTPFKPSFMRDGSGQSGQRYLLWLTKSRAGDVARSERRRRRNAPSFTDVFSPRRVAEGRSSSPRLRVCPQATDGDPDDDRAAAALLVKGCIGRLPDEQRQLVEMLLDGTPQKAMAGALGISEGTISRRKEQAFAALRRHLREAWRVGEALPTAASVRAAPSCQPAEAVRVGPDTPPFVVFLSRASRPVEVSRCCDWHLFGVVTQGVVRSTWLSAPGRPSRHAREGTCSYFPPASDNRFYWEPSQPTDVLQVAVAPDFFRMVADSEEFGSSVTLHGDHCFDDPALFRILRQFGNQNDDAADSLATDLDGHALVMRLLERQGRKRPRWHPDSTRFTHHEMTSLTEYVRDNLGTTFRLQTLSGIVGLSPGHFARKFRQSFGISPADFVRARRVREAARLLLIDDLPIAAIAQRVGFSSQSQFARLFRSIVGTSPARFRAECS